MVQHTGFANGRGLPDGAMRLREIALDELQQIGFQRGRLIPAAELRAVLCRASRRFIAEHQPSR